MKTGRITDSQLEELVANVRRAKDGALHYAAIVGSRDMGRDEFVSLGSAWAERDRLGPPEPGKTHPFLAADVATAKSGKPIIVPPVGGGMGHPGLLLSVACTEGYRGGSQIDVVVRVRQDGQLYRVNLGAFSWGTTGPVRPSHRWQNGWVEAPGAEIARPRLSVLATGTHSASRRGALGAHAEHLVSVEADQAVVGFRFNRSGRTYGTDETSYWLVDAAAGLLRPTSTDDFAAFLAQEGGWSPVATGPLLWLIDGSQKTSTELMVGDRFLTIGEAGRGREEVRFGLRSPLPNSLERTTVVRSEVTGRYSFSASAGEDDAIIASVQATAGYRGDSAAYLVVRRGGRLLALSFGLAGPEFAGRVSPRTVRVYRGGWREVEDPDLLAEVRAGGWPASVTLLGTGFHGQGDAGAMGGHAEYMAIFRPDPAVWGLRLVRGGRLYGAEPTHYWQLDQAARQAIYVSADDFAAAQALTGGFEAVATGPVVLVEDARLGVAPVRDAGYIRLGESGPGRTLTRVEVTPALVERQPEAVLAATVTRSDVTGRYVLDVPVGTPDSLIVDLQSTAGFRGGASCWAIVQRAERILAYNLALSLGVSWEPSSVMQYGDDSWTKVAEDELPALQAAGFPTYVGVLARGHHAEGDAGAMGGHDELLVVLRPDPELWGLRLGRGGRLYGEPSVHYWRFDGQQLELAHRTAKEFRKELRPDPEPEPGLTGVTHYVSQWVDAGTVLREAGYEVLPSCYKDGVLTGLDLRRDEVIPGRKALALVTVGPGGGKRWGSTEVARTGLEEFASLGRSHAAANVLAWVTDPTWSIAWSESRDGQVTAYTVANAGGVHRLNATDGQVYSEPWAGLAAGPAPSRSEFEALFGALLAPVLENRAPTWQFGDDSQAEEESPLAAQMRALGLIK